MTAGTVRGAYRSLEARWREARERVADAASRAGRDPAGITVVAVAKGHPVEATAAAIDIGIADIGESRVQEAQAKRSALGDRQATWHMIGHLQRNKARAATELFDLVHSLDSVTLAASLDRHASHARAPLRVLIEVELTGIAGRAGITAREVPGLLTEIRGLAQLRPVGLMTIAPPGSTDAARDCFARLRTLRDQVAAAHELALPELSMGMSDDFEVAVAEGSTMVRLGRVLFGTPGGTQPPGRPGLS